MTRHLSCLFLALFFLSLTVYQLTGNDTQTDGRWGDISPANCLVWGPGLRSHFVVPVRYFFIQLVDKNGVNLTTSIGHSPFTVQLTSDSVSRVRVQVQQLNRNDGTYIIRFKLYESYKDLRMSLTYQGVNIGSSPFQLDDNVYHEKCDCPVASAAEWLKSMECPKSYTQIKRDLSPFRDINLSEMVEKIWSASNLKKSRSVCHYTIKNNKIYRRTHGEHVGFKMFSDAILLSLSRKVVLPDIEFLVNLGDWPLEYRGKNPTPEPIFSWCGSDDTYDIIMPTYDITDSTLETMGRVTLDIQSVQGNSGPAWKEKKAQAFWRGRDSRKERLDLVKMSMEDPELIDAKLTNMFFFKHDKEQHGDIVKATSFFDFFKYKYQINIDGTVAAYRLPYLLAGGAVVFKQESKYYEYFYKSLKPYVHYIPFKHDLTDLKEKIQWAKENDDKAKEIAENGRNFAQEHLLAKDIFCYHVILFQEYAKRLAAPPKIYDDMELVVQEPDHYKGKCTCHRQKHEKDEL